MKIEPVAYRILDSEASKQYGISKHVYFDTSELRGVPTGEIMKPLYTEAQMRQLGEACAQVAGPEDSYQDEWFNAKADAVNKINARIKELLS